MLIRNFNKALFIETHARMETYAGLFYKRKRGIITGATHHYRAIHSPITGEFLIPF